MNNPRIAAAQAVAAVAGGSSLDEALTLETALLTPTDAALAKAIAFGVVRERRLLAWLASQMLQKPLNKEPVLEALLLCGLYQLRAMRVAPHAAVAETVAAVDELRKSWAKGLVNALLRRYQRERVALESTLPPQLALRLSYPDWLADTLQRDWPPGAEGVLAAGNEQGPLTLRVNRRRGSRDEYLQELAAAGIAARAVAHAPDAVHLETAAPVERIPGFADGRVSVQDAAAQLAVALLDAGRGERVLDACAAPGGKTAQLLEQVDELDVLALDSDAGRLEMVRGNLLRLALDAKLKAGDAGNVASWWDGKPFDRILLDAPCSGTGVIRRHPDIKWLRRATDIPRMAAQQRRLLEALWPLLAPGGTLLYAACSILRAEGEEVVSGFIAAQADAQVQAIDAAWGEACSVGRRIAPGGDFDGFYYARLRKPAG